MVPAERPPCAGRRRARRRAPGARLAASLGGLCAAPAAFVAAPRSAAPRRREACGALALPCVPAPALLPAAAAAAAEGGAAAVEEPLRYCGGGFCAGFTVGGRRFRGVVDTGSPFLMVSTCDQAAGDCTGYCRAWGCTSPGSGEPTGLEDTEEVYAAGSTRVAWRRDSVGLGDAALGAQTYGTMLSVESYSGNGGGAFLGLVRERAQRIRPTFLEQTRYRTVTIDLRRPGEERLALSAEPLRASAAQAVPLVDLREVGAPVRFYAARVAALRVAGQRVAWPRPIVAVLDTGTTGLGLPPNLFEVYDRTRREMAWEMGLRAAQAVEVDFVTEQGETLTARLRQGRLDAYGGEQFDIVTALPEPTGMTPDAAALWQDSAGAQEELRILGGGGVAVPELCRERGLGRAQVERALVRGERFRVRIRAPAQEGAAAEARARGCDAAVGLAPRGSGPLGVANGSAAVFSGSLLTDDGGSIRAPLRPGDVVECGLTDDGSIFWRRNGAPLGGPLPLETARRVYPTVEASQGSCGFELLEAPGAGGAAGAPRWAPGLGAARCDGGRRAGEPPRPSVLFLGLGFLLGRELSLDTVAHRATLT